MVARPRQHDGAGSSAERYDSLDRWLSNRLMSVSNGTDESDRTTANNSMFKQRGRQHVRTHPESQHRDLER